MSDITLEKTHALLEKLANYVMSELPTRIEMNETLAQKADKADLFLLDSKVSQLDEKINYLDGKLNRIDEKMNLMLNGMDAQAQQLDILSTDMKAVSGTLDLHEERLGTLEEHNFGHRVRENKENYNANRKQP